MENACALLSTGLSGHSCLLRDEQGPWMDHCSSARSRSLLTVGQKLEGQVGFNEDPTLFPQDEAGGMCWQEVLKTVYITTELPLSESSFPFPNNSNKLLRKLQTTPSKVHASARATLVSLTNSIPVNANYLIQQDGS